MNRSMSRGLSVCVAMLGALLVAQVLGSPVSAQAPASPASPAPAAPAAQENADWPTIDTLRARAQERMRRDRDTFTVEQLQQLETLYQSANRALKAPGSKDILRQVIEKYPRSNRAGCAALYLARLSEGDDREKQLHDAIENYADAMFGDGVQVGAMARAELAFLYARSGRTADVQKLADEVNQLYPGAVDHRGGRLADGLRRLAATPAEAR
jgi:hypothetical protein